jgi:hypothetical protein
MVGTATVLLTAFFCAAGCARLAHPEENRSSGLRVLCTLVIVAALAWMAWAVPNIGAREPIYGGGLLLLLGLCVPSVLFLTEPATLGRRVRQQVPRSPLLALLWAPFLPGGGRALLYLLLNAGLVYGGTAAIGAWHAGVSLGSVSTLASAELGIARPGSPGQASVGVAAAYVIAYLGLVSLAVARLTRGWRLRVTARLILYVGWIPLAVGPIAAGFFMGHLGEGLFKHPGNPFWLVPAVWPGGFPDDTGPAALTVLVVAVLAVLLQTPRTVRGVTEVLAASARARAVPPAEPARVVASS